MECRRGVCQALRRLNLLTAVTSEPTQTELTRLNSSARHQSASLHVNDECTSLHWQQLQLWGSTLHRHTYRCLHLFFYWRLIIYQWTWSMTLSAQLSSSSPTCGNKNWCWITGTTPPDSPDIQFGNSAPCCKPTLWPGRWFGFHIYMWIYIRSIGFHLLVTWVTNTTSSKMCLKSVWHVINCANKLSSAVALVKVLSDYPPCAHTVI